MDTLKKDEILNELDKIEEMSSTAYPSDQDLKIINEKVKQIKASLTSGEITSEQLESINTEDLRPAKPSDRQIPPQVLPMQEKIEYESDEMYLKQLKQRKNRLRILKEIDDTLDEIDTMKARIEERKKEQSYITSKPDKEGFIKVDYQKAENRIKELQEKLEETEGFWARTKIKKRIGDIQNAVRMAKMNNGMLRTGKIIMRIGKGAKTFADTMQQFSTELGSLSEFGERRSKESDSKTNKRKKGKKKKNKKNKNNDDDKKDNTPTDYGYNTKQVFGAKSYEKYFQ